MLKAVAGIAASFAGLAGTIIFLWEMKMISVEVAKLMLVALLGMYIGFGILIAIYRLISRLGWAPYRHNSAPSKRWLRRTQMTSATLGQSTSAVEDTNVSQHGYWPELDNDLAVASIRDPEQFPLVAWSGK
jgi:membrane protein implicated in regulation of membrane protease activity